MKRNYKMKKTISMKQFIAEFGEGFGKHTKQRLLELGTRCILTRKFEDKNKLILKHIEHTKYDSGNSADSCKKEYAFGQLVMDEGTLYFSDVCGENDEVMQAPSVSDIYNALNSEDIFIDESIKVKRVDDSNIDYIVDNLLEVCPRVSLEHLAIISKYCDMEGYETSVSS